MTLNTKLNRIFIFILLFCVSNNILKAETSTKAEPEYTLEHSYSCPSQCRLHCNVTINEELAKDYQLFSAEWTYYFTNIAENLTLSNGTQFSNNEYNWHVENVLLREYNAGYYTCNFVFTNQTDNVTDTEFTAYYDFKIEPDKQGSLMDESCTANSDCLAIGAICNDQSKCECEGVYNIAYIETPENPICLKSEGYLDVCYLDKQCNDDANCKKTDLQYGHCNCAVKGSVPLSIAELGNVTKCVKPSSLLKYCEYDEECSFTNDNTMCLDSSCECKSGYVMDVNLNKCQPSPISISIKKCIPEDFNNGQNCSLRCTIDATGTYYILLSHNWTYSFTVPKSEHILMFGATFDGDDTTKIYDSSYTLSNYSAGTYICQFQFLDGSGQLQDIYGGFQISQAKEKLLGEKCELDWDCAALNAKCDSTVSKSDMNKTCNCNGYHNIPYYPNALAPACLSPEPENAPCNTDDQCYHANESYVCDVVTNTCFCTGVHTNVAEENNKNMCVIKAYLGALCYYQEQCSVIDQNTFCKDNYCQCKDGFYVDMKNNLCDSTLSTGAIAGIVIGCLAAVIIIISCLILIFKK